MLNRDGKWIYVLASTDMQARKDQMSKFQLGTFLLESNYL